MNFTTVLHQAKSEYAYAYNENTLHIRLKTERGAVRKVELLALDPFNWVPRNDGSMMYDLDKESIIRLEMRKEQMTEMYDCWFAEAGNLDTKRCKYCFVIETEKEKYIMGCHDRIPYKEDESELYNLFNYFNYPYICKEDLYKAPHWVAHTVWYQIFPERFCNGTPGDGRNVLPWGSEEMDGALKKFGGNLEGIIEKLDYIQKAGFTGIYLTPIFKATSSHKYDTIDYFIIDPEFGTNEIFEKLVKEAHQRGIRIMLDAVFNHCGYQHPFWQDVLMHGKESKYYDYFYILDADKPIFDGQVLDGVPQEIPREELNYRTFAYTPTMPKWNTGNPEVREYLLEAACFWTEKYHIDGWRLDVSNEVPHDFWREFRKRVKDRNPELYILGENWDNSLPWLMGDQFDAVMNYEFAMPIWKYFRKEKEGERIYSEEQFRYAIGRLLTSYPKNVTANLFNLLESHDTERILNRAGQDVSLVKLAYLFMFIFPGTPCVYYGGEIGMGGGEHSNRQCMIWEKEKQNRELFEFISRMIELRKKYDSFCSTELQWINSENSLALKKEGAKETLYVFMQKEGKTQEYVLPEELKEKCCMECISGKMVKLGKSIRLERNGYQMYMIFKETE